MCPITVFTPTYNRAHTLRRTYESLCTQTCMDFCWLVIDDGSTDFTAELVKHWIAEGRIPIKYIKKENGGLYTGYNTAYANIDTELSVCIDSDDYMPDDAIELILDNWRRRGSDRYAGLIGLDVDVRNGQPIGGRFPEGLDECYFMDMYHKKLHIGDTKMVLRTDLMKKVAPMEGFPGEKNFNPVYLSMLISDDYPFLLLDRCLCCVEYQTDDSMSAGIFRQYFNSPRSFSKMRRLEMSLRRNTWRNIVRVTLHYVATSIIAGDRGYIRHSPRPVLTTLLTPPGWLLYLYFRHKARKV